MGPVSRPVLVPIFFVLPSPNVQLSAWNLSQNERGDDHPAPAFLDGQSP
jgi:hypothetical protein